VLAAESAVNGPWLNSKVPLPKFGGFRHGLLEDVVATAEAALKAAHVPSEIRDETLSRLAKSQLTTSRQQLIFNYKVKFESMRS
jgi:hypothetical protein